MGYWVYWCVCWEYGCIERRAVRIWKPPLSNITILIFNTHSYPNANCFARFGIGSPQDPQTVFSDYLNHTSGQSIVAPYLSSSSLAQQAGKPFIMFETNSASCGGFPGVSDSFGATLWALDYGLQMAYGNFSGALLHVGGEDDYYNVRVSCQIISARSIG
jgi:hypothetical protein